MKMLIRDPQSCVCLNISNISETFHNDMKSRITQMKNLHKNGLSVSKGVKGTTSEVDPICIPKNLEVFQDLKT